MAPGLAIRSANAQPRMSGGAGRSFSDDLVANDPERSRIETALAALSRALSALGAPWMVIGGIAVIAHGVQRMTTDIDAVIRGDAVSIHALIDVLTDGRSRSTPGVQSDRRPSARYR